MRNYLSLIKFSHTIFALPFALIGFLMGVQTTGVFSWTILVLIIACMVFARTSAMAFNRWADRQIDALNPRTSVREIPAKKISAHSVLLLTIFSAILFVTCTYFINPLCFYLSPIALTVVLGYSYTKRFTSLCHLVLGLGLSLAPIGAYIAVTGHFNLLPVLYSIIVLTWVSGFDIIYALQDADFDKQNGLWSIPSVFGIQKALFLSRSLHGLSFLSLLAAYFYGNPSLIYGLGVFIFALLLLRQHILVKPHDLTKINLAFFTINGIASILLFVFYLIDYLV